MDGRIDLERARRDAKALLSGARARLPDATSRLRAAGLRSDRPPCLADAQAAVARELGVEGWPDLLRDVESGGRTPLMTAALAGDARTVAALLAGGADPGVRNPATGRTALHDAARSGDGRAVSALLEHGA